MWKIGNVEIKNRIVCAPMAGVSNLAYREIIKKMNAGLIYSEMVSNLGIIYNSKNTIDMLKINQSERPISIQIFGSDVDSFVKASKFVNDYAHPDIIDINMGCPAPKVVKNGDGSKLLLDLDKAEKIIKAVVQNSKVPVTLKMRKGWSKENIVACELAKIAEQNGVAAITIHGRTRDEFFGGQVDLETIKRVKETVQIPVIGNGDIIDEKSAINMFKYTNVDGIMIGRGAIGNPWIFKQIRYFLENQEKMDKPNNKEKKEILKEHINLSIKEKGKQVAINEMRKHIAYYTKNMKDASTFRNEINHINQKEELINKIDEYFNQQ